MRLTVVNVSNSIIATEFHAVLSAISKQVKEDFQALWNASAIVRGSTHKLTRGLAPIDGPHGAIIYVGDSSQDPTTGIENALGYHSINHTDIPYGFVYLDICAQFGEEWPATLSHEVLELLADPAAVLTVTGPDPRKAGRNVHFDLEVCDPTQGDTYLVDNVRLSNFVTPAYFGMPSVSSATNFLELALKPFGVRPLGYFQYEDGQGAHQITGERAAALAPQRQAARALMKMGRRNTRRAARLNP
jgi:hypothetical protein